MNKRLGIIGGAGPMGGKLAFEKIIKNYQKLGAYQDSDFPFIMLLSYPFHDMLIDPQKHKKQISDQLQSCFEIFAQNKIEKAIIACNTLHLFITKKPGFELVHLIEETKKVIKNSSRDTLILSTISFRSNNLYELVNCFYPSLEMQKEIDACIYQKLKGSFSEKKAYEFADFLNKYSTKPINMVLGCTELSLLNYTYPLFEYGLNSNFEIIDPLEIAIKKMIS